MSRLLKLPRTVPTNLTKEERQKRKQLEKFLKERGFKKKQVLHRV